MAFDTPTPPFNASDPYARFLSASCLDLLLIELVPMAERIVQDLELAGPGTTETAITTQVHPASSSAAAAGGGGRDGSTVGVAGGGAGTGTIAGSAKPDEEDLREAMFYRLDGLGYRVGQGLAERFSRDRPRFTDNLDVIKFLCKDLWTILFRKQIDNLKTNHRGVYVLTDNSFRPFTRMSMAVRSEAVARAQAHLWFPCGVIRGVLSSLGITATVQAESPDLPGATFQIKTVQAKA